jgi:hypothetical protein
MITPPGRIGAAAGPPWQEVLVFKGGNDPNYPPFAIYHHADKLSDTPGTTD